MGFTLDTGAFIALQRRNGAHGTSLSWRASKVSSCARPPELLEDTGEVTVSASTFPGLALCDFLELENAGVPAADRIYARVFNEHPDVVVLQFWGNPFSDCIRDAGFDTEAYG